MAHDRRSFFRRVVGAAAALVAVPACLRDDPVSWRRWSNKVRRYKPLDENDLRRMAELFEEERPNFQPPLTSTWNIDLWGDGGSMT